MIATASEGGGIALWRTDTWLLLRSIPLAGDSVKALAFSNDGHYLAAGTREGAVCVWDAADATLVGRWVGRHGGSIGAVRFSPEGQRIAAGTGWKPSGEQLLGKGHYAFEMSVQIWSLARRKGAEWTVPGTLCQALAWTPDGRRVAVAGMRKTLAFVNARKGSVARGLDMGSVDDRVRFLSCLCAAPSGGALYIGTVADVLGGARILSWNEDTFDFRCLVDKTPWDYIRAIAVSADGRWLAAVGGKISETLKSPYARVRFDFAPEGGARSIGHEEASVDAPDWSVRIWDTQTGEEARCYEGSAHPLTNVAFVQADTKLVAATAAGSLMIWDLAPEQPASSGPIGHTERIDGASVSPSGRYLATASFDGTVRVWDVADRRCISMLDTVQTPCDAAFLPDERRLLIAVENSHQTGQLWDLFERKPRLRLPLPEGQMARSCVVSPDGRRIAFGLTSGDVFVFRGLEDTEPTRWPCVLPEAPALRREVVYMMPPEVARQFGTPLPWVPPGDSSPSQPVRDVRRMAWSPDGALLSAGMCVFNQDGAPPRTVVTVWRDANIVGSLTVAGTVEALGWGDAGDLIFCALSAPDRLVRWKPENGETAQIAGLRSDPGAFGLQCAAVFCTERGSSNVVVRSRETGIEVAWLPEPGVTMFRHVPASATWALVGVRTVRLYSIEGQTDQLMIEGVRERWSWSARQEPQAHASPASGRRRQSPESRSSGVSGAITTRLRPVRRKRSLEPSLGASDLSTPPNVRQRPRVSVGVLAKYALVLLGVGLVGGAFALSSPAGWCVLALVVTIVFTKGKKL